MTLPYENYEPRTRYYEVEIRGKRFRPNRMEAFIGDTVIANITNKQGLHRIRETYTNKVITILPDSTYELIFYAQESGEHLLTCNPFCEDPMEAIIEVLKPYRTVC